jgi:D-alanine-D-alanine ligase
MGGPSAEHDVSLSSGKVVVNALDRQRYEVIPVVITRGGQWSIPPEELPQRADIAFIALHGEYGEDGTVQELLRRLGLPFTGSDVLPSALAMNKILTANLFRAYGLNVPRSVVVDRSAKEAVQLNFDFPLVVKPVDRGSSVGVSIVRRGEEIEEALEKAFSFSRQALIQEYIVGREITCSVIDNGDEEVIPLPPTEIIPRTSHFFDYHAKYTQGATDEITPADLDPATRDLVQTTAVLAHQAIGASGMSRTDMILAPSGWLYVLEINTIPGLTPTSLFPQAALAHGLTLPELFHRLIEAGLRRHGLILKEFS